MANNLYALVFVDEDKNYTPVVTLDLDQAVAADYLSFIQGITEILLSRTEPLEKEANASGRTILHERFGAFGSLPLDRE